MFQVVSRYEVVMITATKAEWEAARARLDPRSAQVVSNTLGLLPKYAPDDRRVSVTLTTRGPSRTPIDALLAALRAEMEPHGAESETE